jgi:hypothetical protein
MAEVSEGRVIEPVKQLSKYGADSSVKLQKVKALGEDRKICGYICGCEATKHNSLLCAVQKLLHGNKKK